MAIMLETRSAAGKAPSYVRTQSWQFLSSLPVDRKLYRFDIAGSIAHVKMLGAVGILTGQETETLTDSLKRVCGEIEDGLFEWREDLEDVHTNIEVRLTELLGPLGAKVHTARSRNDQIALDERLYLREAICTVQQRLLQLQLTILRLAEDYVETLMPGYTHMQRAQPVTLAHHLLAHFWRLARDFKRLSDCFHRADVSPLGAGALAGSTLPIDPELTARLLGFRSSFENSMDAVSDRDYFAEFLFDLSLISVHLSSVGEEIVLWATTEFAFIRPTSELGSGSSLMPQKRNPDVAELARAKGARVQGDLMSLLTTLKSLPLSYNRDLQEDKAPVFDGVARVLDTLEAIDKALSSAEFDVDRMARAANDLSILATDLAEYLVAHGIPFRDAHETVADYMKESGGKISAKSLQEYSTRFGADVKDILDARTSLSRRRTPGGPSPEAVLSQLTLARDDLGLGQWTLSKRFEIVDTAEQLLKEELK